MIERKIAHGAEQFVPETPEVFQKAMQATLEQIAKDAPEKEKPRKRWPARRMVLLAAALLLALTTAALAVMRWSSLEEYSFIVGENPEHADEVMQEVLCQETVNDVEITIREAGYDGRTLFVQYSYRMLDVEETLDEVDEDGYHWLKEEAGELLDAHNVGWWTDHLWFDGVEMGMPGGSSAMERGSDVPGEIIRTELWRLDKEDVSLSGKVNMSMPIGEKQPLDDYSRKEHPEKYDAEGRMLLPEKGVVTFSIDTSDILDKVQVVHPGTSGHVTNAQMTVEEICYTPLQTYIDLSYTLDEGAMEAFIAENGEGLYDESGKLIFPYDEAMALGDKARFLRLVEEDGRQVFEQDSGCEYTRSTMEYVLPYVNPDDYDELYLAPMSDDGKIDMTQKIRIK